MSTRLKIEQEGLTATGDADRLRVVKDYSLPRSEELTRWIKEHDMFLVSTQDTGDTIVQLWLSKNG